MKSIISPLVGQQTMTGLRRREKTEPGAVAQVRKGFWHKERLQQLSALLFVLVLCSLIYVFRDAIESLEAYGYLGAFLIPMLCYAIIVD